MQRYVKDEINHHIAHQVNGAHHTCGTKQDSSTFGIKSHRKNKPPKM